MAQGRVDEAAAVMEGEVIAGSPDGRWRGAVLDSRRVAGGELFFALPGERTDGHLYAGQALARGAAAVVVERPVEAPAAGAVIRVDAPQAALHRLTRAVRRRTPRRLVGVTGSAGKTTTKELLAAMLARRYRVARNPGNLNNLLGFPIALLGIAEDTEWMVAEMGMSTPGELREIARLGRPDVALMINVRPVHLEFFGSLRAIAEAKSELLEGLAPDGLVVANRDDAEVVRITRRHGARTVWFGRGEEADYRATDVEPAAAGEIGSRFTLRAGGERRRVRLPLHGLFNVENCLAAAACAHALGVALDDIAAAVAEVAPAAMRGVVHRLAGGTTVIDDSYNSNPDALRGALESARQLAGRRHWAVLGDMLELGPEAPAFHRAAGAAAVELGFAPVFGVGPLARELVAAAAAAGVESAWFPDAAAATALVERLAPGDVVLVKGSRGVALDRVVAALTAPGSQNGDGGAEVAN